MSSTTESPSLICGVTDRVIPDVLALDGLEGILRAVRRAPVLVKDPVTNGTFWPTVM
jgi:hypothetical protein